MSDIEEEVMVIPTGKPCWGCVDLLTELIPMTGENFYCTDWEPKILIGKIRKIMDGCIVPREITKGCYCGK